MRKLFPRFLVLALAVMVLMLFAGVLTAAPATTLVWDQDFSVDSSGWFDGSNGWYGSIAVAGGSATFTGDSNFDAPFSRFDGYRSVWMGDWAAEIDVYLDPAWPLGTGFDYSVAANGSDGAHQRDYIFHVTKDTSSGSLLVAGSNNTNFTPREDLETINHYEVLTAGWYTLQHVFYEDAGALAVDLNLLDSNGAVLFTETRLPLLTGLDPDLIPTNIGGNRYAWFTFINVPTGVEVDNHQLYFAVPSIDLVGDSVVCDPTTVEIQIDDVEGLYGYEFIVDYDETLVSALGSFVYDWFDPSVPARGFSTPGWNADCTTVPGQCKFAYTRGAPDGEITTATPQTIASIQFTSLLGDAGSFPVTVRDVKLTDKDSFEIPGAVGGSVTLDVCGTATVSGKISLQGRPQPGRPVISEAPAVFSVALSGGPYGPYTGVVNPTDGTYTISGVKYDVGGSNYTLEADHSVYLKASELLSITGSIPGKNTKLLSGDANDDTTVTMADLTCIGGKFGATTAPFTCSVDPTTADLNDDFIVNIQDLSLAAGNYLLSEPQDW